MRICLIINPRAGQSRPGSALPQIRDCLSGWCETLEVRETDSRGAAERFASSIKPGEFDRVVVCGGDGTINEVLNGLNGEFPLGILPLGTANVLARELRIPVNDLPAACAVLRDCRPRSMDLGSCNGRKFSLMAGIGFDAEAVKDLVPNVKDLIGAPAYIFSAMRALAELPERLRYRVELDGERLVVSRGMLLIVANAASYGGDLQIAPLASLEDGWLDLCLFRERSKLAFLGQLWWVLLRRHMHDPRFAYFRAKTVRIQCRPPAAVQLDGDYFGRTPVEIKILPGAIEVVRPE